jgi:hypothetical protein
MDTAITDAAITTVTDDPGRSLKLIRGLFRINLTLVALQPLTAGLFLSGYGRAITIHAGVALALLLGAFLQLVTACVLWRRRRVPAWIAGVSIALFVMLFLEVGFGYTKRYWLHLPIGVGIFGWLIRQKDRLDAL